MSGMRHFFELIVELGQCYYVAACLSRQYDYHWNRKYKVYVIFKLLSNLMLKLTGSLLRGLALCKTEL